MTTLLDPAFVRVDVTAPDRDALLSSMADDLAAAGYVKDSFKAALLAREERFPTGLPTQGLRVAIPHTDVEHVNSSFISIARLASPIAFHEMGANARTVDVDLVFMLAIADKTSQVGTLQALIGMFSQPESMQRLIAAPDAATLYGVVRDQISPLAA